LLRSTDSDVSGDAGHRHNAGDLDSECVTNLD
jgi:hypothetical protein